MHHKSQPDHRTEIQLATLANLMALNVVTNAMIEHIHLKNTTKSLFFKANLQYGQ
jgi:hypothetical protein